jgi:hypothetical protein
MGGPGQDTADQGAQDDVSKPDHFPVSLTRGDERGRDVVEESDDSRRHRLAGTAEQDVAKVEQPALADRTVMFRRVATSYS